MIEVMIADDERIIREGLAFGVDWASLGMKVVALAGDGREALNKILEIQPDLVMIDIRMPEMSGLDVVRSAREKLGNGITFIILSGYSEFTYAQQGMSYGVAEYLLKPTDDKQLLDALNRARTNIEREKRRIEFEKEMRENMERQMPILREHLLKDYITNSYSDAEDFEDYKKYFDLTQNVRLVVYQIANETGFEELFSLKSLIEKKLEGRFDFMCFSIRNQILILLETHVEGGGLVDVLKEVNAYFHNFYDSSLRVIYTEEQPVKILPYMYAQVNKCTRYSFYLSDEYIIKMEDILNNISRDYDASFSDFDEITDCINIGNTEKTRQYVASYFKRLTDAKIDVNITKTYLTELYMRIIRCSKSAETEDYIRETLMFSRAASIDDIKAQIMRLATEVAESNYNEISDSYSKNIEQAIRYVDEHLSDNELTLKNLCNKVLFINPDYFGRLFKKEIGEKFTRYVTAKRISAAKKIIAEGKINNISEIAEAVGFGDGAQYFSQVFRKLTGYTPSEYREHEMSKDE